ncbi:hypothetical protein ACHAW5_000496 [Stephanodiscus triporus]|uniref:Uncharacterized protein n=1 Tax=Stephanodiscus triporus TaxID=2934178 RepID=A0ABD3PRM5_9STRA
MNSETTTTMRGGDGRRTDDHDHDNHDRRLVDPILGRSITRAGLDWLAAGVADFVREGVALWIEESGWSEDEARSHRIGVTVDVYPTSSLSLSLRGDGAWLSSSAALASASASSPNRCKGGVGKSTVAVNLAYRLSASGGRIGLLMLLGYVSPDSGVPGSCQGGGAAVMRGPMAGKVMQQLLHGTNWGSLDVLVLDLLPGTGDVQLEAILAWADADKGIRMFGDMGVPTLAVVENMSYFVCEGGGKHYPFGKSRDWDDKGGSPPSSAAAVAASHYLPGLTCVFRLPISSNVHESNESGTPLCCNGAPGGLYDSTTDVFKDLADAILTDLLILRHRGNPSSTDRATTTSVVTIDEAGGSNSLMCRGWCQNIVAGINLRCRDPRTGEEEEEAGGPTPDYDRARGGTNDAGGRRMRRWRRLGRIIVHGPASCLPRRRTKRGCEEDGMFPTRVTRKGNYGYEVKWGNGTKIIYSLLAIAKGSGREAPPWIVGEQRR